MWARSLCNGIKRTLFVLDHDLDSFDIQFEFLFLLVKQDLLLRSYGKNGQPNNCPPAVSEACNVEQGQSFDRK